MISNKDMQKWLSQKLAESNYKYDGLWIGGRRKDVNSDWLWTNKNLIIPKDMVLSAYPNWYELPNHLHEDRNCLIIDRQGHDVPRFLPENCQLRRPCICETIDKRKVHDKEKIIETANISVNGYLYTLYTVVNEENEDLNNFGVKKLNGGGITWKEAQVECRKREKHMALIFSNDVAVSIAAAMMKSRPSMESIWLGAWSADGYDWSWISSGCKLPSVKSNVSLYPPWLPGHPIILSDEECNRQRSGRCLILDRHLCPHHITPVFLDVDCEKRRPFLCQDVIPDNPIIENDNLYIAMEDSWLKISESYMTYEEGIHYCEYYYGHVASIFDFKTLALILEKMTELSLDHLWVGGRTKYIDGEYKWIDENNEVLKRNGIGARSSWCLGDDESSLPKAESNTCLNLDREARGLPLFYGLPCNGTKQPVLCRISYSNDTYSNETSDVVSTLTNRISKLTNVPKSGILFVIDDSISILNRWLAEQFKLASVIIRNYFPLSKTHPLGLITFSKRSKVIFDFNQTNECSAINSLADQLILNRGLSQDDKEINDLTTSLINAVDTASSIVLHSNLSKTMTLFITDGEHSEDTSKIQVAVEQIKSLRNAGHEVLAMVIIRGQNQSYNYDTVNILFNDRSSSEQNLFYVEDYKGLGKLIKSLNVSTLVEKSTCKEPAWIVPKDDELLSRLVQ
ncbi:uncharacterized protein LOC107273316 isoform X2 [Cephus cinctus]|nr:uncharacterized protein LOC107273316 isoform X2 [Cephus cinctus]